MTTVKAPPLNFAKVPIVDKAGNPSWNFLQWVQKIETQASASLTTLGLNPNAPIKGTTNTVGIINNKTQNLNENGTLPATSLTGSVSGGQVGFTLQNVPDGTSRFAVDNGANLNGVAQVDASNLAIINFSDTAHQNKILDNINDGTVYQRFSRIGNGQAALATSLIGSLASNTTTVAVAGALNTDTAVWSFQGAPDSAYFTGIILFVYMTAGNINFVQVNETVGPITPGATKVNWQVIR